MKYKKSVRKPDKLPCMCAVHIKGDVILAKPIPCLGHGIGCPCSDLIAEALLKTTTEIVTP